MPRKQLQGPHLGAPEEEATRRRSAAAASYACTACCARAGGHLRGNSAETESIIPMYEAHWHTGAACPPPAVLSLCGHWRAAAPHTATGAAVGPPPP
mmetsp:Transcript_37052/g.118050  ORF Transcript_37052/g.118050 Transcript_37052/m.118050 type:complete len:97 (-) Transcript_37052:1096-1386(-)|eukprot:scaffold12231_cov103-Isochrysis_galbana.AAC.6